MKKAFLFICLIIAIGAFIGSCSKSDSYAERLKQQEKAIDNFLKDNNIEVLSLYPAKSQFKANQYYLDRATGIYLHVVDTGNGKRASVENRSDVLVRFWDARSLPSPDSIKLSNDGNGKYPLNFLYGVSGTYQVNTSTSDYNYLFLSPAMAFPLQYVGEGAVVKLIIPFTQGSYYHMYKDRLPMYYGKLKYTKIHNN